MLCVISNLNNSKILWFGKFQPMPYSVFFMQISLNMGIVVTTLVAQLPQEMTKVVTTNIIANVQLQYYQFNERSI